MKVENISLNTHNGKLPNFNKNIIINSNTVAAQTNFTDEYIKKNISLEIENEKNSVLKNVKTNFFKIGKSFQKII